MPVALTPFVLLLIALSAAGKAGAATLADIAAALTAPAGAAQATNDWAAFTKLAGVKWKGKAPAKGDNKYCWNGAVPIDGVGAGHISLVGSKTAPAQQGVDLLNVRAPTNRRLKCVPF